MKHEVVVDCVVDLYTFYNFFLDSEGYCQIRATMQADSRYYSQVFLCPKRTLNGTYVSKTFFVTNTCESIQTDLNETFRFEVHLFLKDDVRVRLADTFYELRLELWLCKIESEEKQAEAKAPPVFTAVTARVLTLTFDPARGLHHYYPLVFEVSNACVLTMTIHASLVTICIPNGQSMRNATMGHFMGQLCICDAQSSCCYSAAIDKAVQQELNALMTQTASHLRQILEEHKKPRGGKQKESRGVEIGSDPGSERARARVSRYTTFDRPDGVRFPDEDAKKLSVIVVVLWEQYLDAVVGCHELRFVLYEPLQRARVTRLAEAYVILEKDAGAVYYDPVINEDYYRKLAQKIRKSTYFKMFPVLEVECWPLDGNYKNTPIIFEERYRTVRSTPTSEQETSTRSPAAQEVAEAASLRSLSPSSGSMELLALAAHPESEVCNCRRQFRAMHFHARRPSTVSLSADLQGLYGSSGNDTQGFSRVRKALWNSFRIPVPWRTPDIAELLLLNLPPPTTARSDNLHLIVLVHGMYGSAADLRLLRVFLELAQPFSNVRFLMSKASEREETFRDFDTLGMRLASEVVDHIKKHAKKPARISFIGFSMGNIIIRSALMKAQLQPLLRSLHTYLSLCGPHMGTIFNTSLIINIGLWYIHRFESADSLKQMMLTDSPDIRKTYLYRLSKDKGLTNFKNILLLGSSEDYIVPLHSAHIKLAKHIAKDNTTMGVAYREMQRNILSPLMDKPEINLVRLEVHVPYRPSLVSTNVHIAPLDCEMLAEKIASIACARHLL